MRPQKPRLTLGEIIKKEGYNKFVNIQFKCVMRSQNISKWKFVSKEKYNYEENKDTWTMFHSHIRDESHVK